MNTLRNVEPGRKEKEAAWQTAVGLQAADGLRASEYLLQTAQKHISGKISIGEARYRINDYYLERNTHDAGDPDKEEADKVAVNIADILLSRTLDLSIEGLALLHRKIFEGVYGNAGVPRDYDVSKREWVLGGDSISFTKFEQIPQELEKCIAQERMFRYQTASTDEVISHLSAFIAGIWKICPFGEGNTRFAGVLTEMLLRSLGINIEFDTFRNESWYFYNALIRANYRDIEKNIECEPVYLERFFRNMLLGEQWDLRNRYLHVRPAAEWSIQPKLSSKTRAGQVQIKQSTRKVKEKDNLQTSKEEVETKIEAPKPEIPATNPENSPKKQENLSDNTNILFLAVVIGEDFLAVKEIMEHLKLKGRDNFLKLYLTPAVNEGLVALLYPNSPRHPRQKYLLTQKGLEFLRSIDPEMRSRIERHLSIK